MYYKQNLGNTKNNVVRYVCSGGGNDVILQNIFDGLVYAVEKKNFDKFYEEYVFPEEAPYEPNLEELDVILEASGLGKVKKEMDIE